MAETTGIAWTDSTLNPWIGCTAVSPACDACYAQRLAEARLGVKWGAKEPRRRTAPGTWAQAERWNRKAAKEGRTHRVFCASLADVFDNAIDPAWRADLWALVERTPALTWQILTKRPQNIAKMLPPSWGDGWPHVWLGTTVENQAEADRRIPHLLAAPARTRFLSCEPLLGPVDLTRLRGGGARWTDALSGLTYYAPGAAPVGPSIDWVIAGGESGPGFRAADMAWFRSLRDQCRQAGTAFFMKQTSGLIPATMPPIPADLMVREFPA